MDHKELEWSQEISQLYKALALEEARGPQERLHTHLEGMCHN